MAKLKNITTLGVFVILAAELFAAYLLHLPEGWPRFGAAAVVLGTAVGLYIYTHKAPPTEGLSIILLLAALSFTACQRTPVAVAPTEAELFPAPVVETDAAGYTVVVQPRKW